jgi:prephenate dehydrogenase
MPETRRQLPVLQPQSPAAPAGPAPSAAPAPFERMAIVGLGLMGGSIALAARAAWPQALVIGVDRGAVLERAMRSRAVDVGSADPMIVSEADLVVLATPVGEIVRLLGQLPGRIAGEAVVTDVGGTKRAIAAAARALPERLPFVGGHPLAGAARGGFDAARPDLCLGRPWLLVPGAGAPATSVDKLRAFVEGVGARPVVLASAAEHDRLLALLSHLPQLTASALMAVVGEGVGEDGLALAGRGLVDTTRLASSPADIWRDICSTNADEIGVALDRLIAVLGDLRGRLADGSGVERLFDTANRWRARLPLGGR